VDCIQHARSGGMEREADTLEALVDVMVYGLYFPQDMKAADCYINDRMARALTPGFPAGDDAARGSYIKKLVGFCVQDEAVSRGLERSADVPVVRTITGGGKDEAER
ncbi:MAG: hypothetical protein JXM71_11530, partial [Spirochaetales bacterium]|nr:hypothetical protein [Spirochaetales bacterium]